MKYYLVGGAVRDKLLNWPVVDKDWVVVGASLPEMKTLGFTQVGKGFPVFLHPETKDEYALARTEVKTKPGYTGFDFDASSSVTLEEDLLRRDLTINAMAQTDEGGIIDPYDGQGDIDKRLLRHVSPAFSEDPLRVLRVARFAARFAHLGFAVADETMELMAKIADSGELDYLVKERVWQEIERALEEKDPSVFIATLRDCNALKFILPEVDNLFGVPQPEKYHPEIDTGVHILMCMEAVAKLSNDPVVRYATLVHDVGKAVTPRSNWPHHYDHEKLGLSLQAGITKRLRVPNEFSDIARLVCEHHTKLHRLKGLRAKTVLSLLEALDAFRRPGRVGKFLLACEADVKGRTGFEEGDYPQKALLNAACAAASSIDAGALLKQEEAKNIKPAEFIRQHRLAAVEKVLVEFAAND
jgi:tRNA nucleotidyltransferase (CCA-adding enzyme)